MDGNRKNVSPDMSSVTTLSLQYSSAALSIPSAVLGPGWSHLYQTSKEKISSVLDLKPAWYHHTFPWCYLCPLLSVSESRAEANNHWHISWQPVGLCYKQVEEPASCTHWDRLCMLLELSSYPQWLAINSSKWTFKPVCRLFGLLAKCGQGGVINSILEMFPSFRCICISWAWKGFLKHVNRLNTRFPLHTSIVTPRNWWLSWEGKMQISQIIIPLVLTI